MDNREAELIERPRMVSRDHYLLKIRISGEDPHPGQFVNIRIGHGTDPLIRRPFSVHDFSGGVVSLIVRDAGRGTHMLAGMEPGPLDVMAPLGKGFTPVRDRRALLAGGGVGNAPLYYLARILKESNTRVTFIYGHRSRDHLFLEDLYRALSDHFIVATDDGSAGEKGNTAEIMAGLGDLESYDAVYTCGPQAMMKKIAGLVKPSASIQVSLENYFGCGIGLCSGCTVETAGGLMRACVDGPVFDGRGMVW